MTKKIRLYQPFGDPGCQRPGKDKQRQSYYNYYSMKKWGRADTYNLSLDVGLLGVDGTVKLLSQVIEDFENKS